MRNNKFSMVNRGGIMDGEKYKAIERCSITE
jgi:hypothetical protein